MKLTADGIMDSKKWNALMEILGMSNRILVMRNGRITGEITDTEKATQTEIMELAVH